MSIMNRKVTHYISNIQISNAFLDDFTSFCTILHL